MHNSSNSNNFYNKRTNQIRWMTKPVDIDLYNACRRGDIKQAQQALEKGADPNCYINNALGENIPIFICASQGYEEIAALLISKGLKLNNTLGYDGSTPLHHACRGNQLKMVSFLIDHGCDVNKANKLERTPLMEASSVGNVELVTLLHGKGADLDKCDLHKKTALSYAVDNVSRVEPKWYETAKKLVELGADVNVTGHFANGVTILHCAAAQGDLEFVKLLIENKSARMDCQDEVGKTPLDYATIRGQKEVVTYLQSTSDTSCCCIL